MENKVATFHEFGQALQVSRDAGESVKKIADEMLLHTFDEMLEYLPDVVFNLKPTLMDGPVIYPDTLTRGVRMVVASPIYDYWYEEGTKRVKVNERLVKSRLRHQSNKNWWTRLLWKLGGFDVE